MLRTFGIQTLTGNAQPIFTDATTGVVLSPVGDAYAKVPVANTTIYQPGDYIILTPGTNSSTMLHVDNIDAANHLLLCTSQTGAKIPSFPNGTQITISIACMEVIVQADNANTQVVYVGPDKTITSAGLGNVAYEVSPSLDPFRMTYGASANLVRTSDAWMAGPAGQKVVVSAVVQ